MRNISQMLREEKTEENSVDEKNNKEVYFQNEEEAARRPVSFSLDSGVVNKHKSLRLVKSAVSAESTELKAGTAKLAERVVLHAEEHKTVCSSCAP